MVDKIVPGDVAAGRKLCTAAVNRCQHCKQRDFIENNK